MSYTEIDKLIHFHRNVMDWPSLPHHGVTKQGIHYVLLLMMTGLRRSEGFGLTWVDVDFEKKLFTVRDIKNSTNHVVPMSTSVEWTLKQQREFVGDTNWVFPAAIGGGHMTEPSSQLAKITAATGLDFCLMTSGASSLQTRRHKAWNMNSSGRHSTTAREVELHLSTSSHGLKR